VECPAGSERQMSLWEVASELSQRLIAIFEPEGEAEPGARPVHGGTTLFQHDPHWRDYVLFYEYFHGDNGAGLGASHQTGWTGLVAKLIQQQGEYGG
ncbi:MAG: glucosidase, partial [Nodosilinea sp.]